MIVRIFSAGVNPTPIARIPPPAQTPRARSAVPPAKAMPAAAKGWRQPKRSVIRVEMLPILSDLPQVTAFFDRYRVGANRLETQHALVERAGLVEVEGRKGEVGEAPVGHGSSSLELKSEIETGRAGLSGGGLG